jgi:hypothetical protein
MSSDIVSGSFCLNSTWSTIIIFYIIIYFPFTGLMMYFKIKNSSDFNIPKKFSL